MANQDSGSEEKYGASMKPMGVFQKRSFLRVSSGQRAGG